MSRAEQDEVVVDKLLPDPDVAVEILGFHCQQAVEKLLKAVLAENAVAYRRTHDLGYLMELLQERGTPVPAELQDLEELAPFAVESRYELLDEIAAGSVDLEAVRDRLRGLRVWATGQVEPPAVPQLGGRGETG